MPAGDLRTRTLQTESLTVYNRARSPAWNSGRTADWMDPVGFQVTLPDQGRIYGLREGKFLLRTRSAVMGTFEDPNSVRTIYLLIHKIRGQAERQVDVPDDALRIISNSYHCDLTYGILVGAVVIRASDL